MRRKLADFCMLLLIYGASFFSVVLLAGILLYVFVNGIPAVTPSFLTEVSSALRGTVGIGGNIVNTLYIVGLTLLIAVPSGIGVAVWLNEYAKRGTTVRIIEFAVGTLSGIPSIIFGLFGMVFFGNGLGLGYSILTGALTLSLMILPYIVRSTQDALRTVPEGYRSGAVGMGATRWYMIRTVLLPAAKPGIVTGIILAVGRIVGESAALLFTAGSGYLLPKSAAGAIQKMTESGGTLAVQLYLCMSKAQFEAAFGIAVVLLCIVFFMNLLAKFLTGKWDVSHGRR